ncbi:RNA 2',3'-cyclic phosphodiesterase [uncultured archaeon]|nr:RNA 2',3'-cyclic phosphodiesterase [uncultured archaeon]
MRLFIALVPPAEILEDLKNVQAEMAGGQTRPSASAQAGWDRQTGTLLVRRSPWKASGPEQLHLTLQFLGDDINLHRKEEIRKKLQEVGPRHVPFEIKPAGMGAFPSPARASVVWAGVQGAGLEGLAQDLASALSSLGIRRDKPFSPHITLLRSKIPQSAQEMMKPMAGRAWSEKNWVAGEFVLFESHAALGGREHIQVQKYPLGGDGEK